MKRFCLLLLLLFALPTFAAPVKPKAGTYKFIQEHTLTVATEFSGGRGIDPAPTKSETRTYKPGEQIKLDIFGWNDKSKTWEARVVFHGTNLLVPMSKLKLVK